MLPSLQIAADGKEQGACPPQDIGGLAGYYHFLQVMNDPKHPEHEDMLEWAEALPRAPSMPSRSTALFTVDGGHGGRMLDCVAAQTARSHSRARGCSPQRSAVQCRFRRQRVAGARGGHMRNAFAAVVEHAGRWHIPCCPELPGADGQGRTRAAALKGLSDAIALILEDRQKDGVRGVPISARRERLS
jgi:predicted RNase H-like HicB family nuclease